MYYAMPLLLLMELWFFQWGFWWAYWVILRLFRIVFLSFPMAFYGFFNGFAETFFLGFWIVLVFWWCLAGFWRLFSGFLTDFLVRFLVFVGGQEFGYVWKKESIYCIQPMHWIWISVPRPPWDKNLRSL